MLSNNGVRARGDWHSLWRWTAAVSMALLLTAGCSSEPEQETGGVADAPPVVIALPAEPEFSSILAQEAYAMLGRQQGTLIVDVRSPAEREQLRIPGSVPFELGDILAGRAQLPKDKPLLLVCAVGGRSYAAGLYLAKEKYPLVYNLRGGLAAWEKAGLPLEYGSKQP